MVAVAAMAHAQTQNVEVEPVTCWWRASAAAVRMGEPFTVLLTCSILETDAVRAVVDRSRLGPAAVQFPPYEVSGGSQSEDYVTAGRRFAQYEYTLRLIAEDAFGGDVPVPGLDIAYRIESQVQEDSALQGREQSYQLPPIPMRVASLVPGGAQSIRELRAPSLAAIAARGFRARLFRIVATILFGLAALTALLALVRWMREGRVERPQAARVFVANRTILGAVRRELRGLQHETQRAGWSVEAAARALAAARIVASFATRRAVVQRPVDHHADDGELLLIGAWPARRRIAVSGSTTAHELAASAHGEFTGTDLETALARFNAARYGRTPALDAGRLDDALATAIQAADRVAARHTWMAEAREAMANALRAWRPRAWAR